MNKTGFEKCVSQGEGYMSNRKSHRYMEQLSEIRRKLGDRDYILGLDLGVGSIGSAVVALQNVGNGRFIPADIVYSGARVFPASSGAADRRAFRSQRNSLRHRKNRLKWLWKTLAEKGLMLPFSTEEVPDPAVLRFSSETRAKNPYELRFEGLTQELSLSELGYALYHLANHRGSSSVFADDEIRLMDSIDIVIMTKIIEIIIKDIKIWIPYVIKADN